MFSIGRFHVQEVLHDIPDAIERKMKRFHQKWFKEAATLRPWSVGDEVGATLRLKCDGNEFAISWGCASVREFTVYDGDVAGEIATAANSEEKEKVEAARDRVFQMAVEGIPFRTMEDLVGDVLKRIKSVGLAMRLMK
jgi:hypothetical protein